MRLIKAKDISDCSECPLYQNDCVGGWTSGGGIPIEPPCCSWNDDQEIYEGMYDVNYEYSEQELKEIEEERRETWCPRCGNTLVHCGDLD